MLIQCLHGSHLFIYYALSTDFVAHSDHLYVFTNETNELPIATELVEDLLAEDDEAINICLPNLQDYTMAELADPDCVRVTINDNDRKKHYPLQCICMKIQYIGLYLLLPIPNQIF